MSSTQGLRKLKSRRPLSCDLLWWLDCEKMAAKLPQVISGIHFLVGVGLRPPLPWWLKLWPTLSLLPDLGHMAPSTDPLTFPVL